MSGHLTLEQQGIIRSIINNASPENIDLIEKATNGTLSTDEIDEMCDLISKEFMMNGINEDFEPNNYGRALEDILDIVNRKRLQSD